jgi:predicted ArsR family transcriptional regulator
MQETRQQILEILRDSGESTVDELVERLEKRRGSITAVTVRHHLSKLRDDGLVDMSQKRHRATPGRPRHVYALTQQGLSHFPNNYQTLAETLLGEIRQKLPEKEVNVILEGVATSMAQDAHIPQGTLKERLEAVVDYLDEHGYDASWEAHDEGYVLITCNCPYHPMHKEGDDLCQMDMHLIAKMLGVVPRLLSRISDDDESCRYLIPAK